MIRNQSYRQQQQDRLKAQIHSFEVTVLDFIKMTFALWTFVGICCSLVGYRNGS